MTLTTWQVCFYGFCLFLLGWTFGTAWTLHCEVRRSKKK